MFELRVQPQEHVIDQGDDGDNFYVIERCVYACTVSSESLQSRHSLESNVHTKHNTKVPLEPYFTSCCFHHVSWA
jgi:hypothetical protein